MRIYVLLGGRRDREAMRFRVMPPWLGPAQAVVCRYDPLPLRLFTELAANVNNLHSCMPIEFP